MRTLSVCRNTAYILWMVTFIFLDFLFLDDVVMPFLVMLFKEPLVSTFAAFLLYFILLKFFSFTGRKITSFLMK